MGFLKAFLIRLMGGRIGILGELMLGKVLEGGNPFIDYSTHLAIGLVLFVFFFYYSLEFRTKALRILKCVIVILCVSIGFGVALCGGNLFHIIEIVINGSESLNNMYWKVFMEVEIGVYITFTILLIIVYLSLFFTIKINKCANKIVCDDDFKLKYGWFKKIFRLMIFICFLKLCFNVLVPIQFWFVKYGNDDRVFIKSVGILYIIAIIMFDILDIVLRNIYFTGYSDVIEIDRGMYLKVEENEAKIKELITKINNYRRQIEQKELNINRIKKLVQELEGYLPQNGRVRIINGRLIDTGNRVIDTGNPTGSMNAREDCELSSEYGSFNFHSSAP